jgi:hypothetical protein
MMTNFPSRGRSDRIIVRGTTATSDEPTGNFGSVLEDILIGNFRLVKTLQAIFGVLQHNQLKNRQRHVANRTLWNVGIARLTRPFEN